jgi:hypothetical protein
VLQNFGKLSFSSLTLGGGGTMSVCNRSAVFYKNPSGDADKVLFNQEESRTMVISPETHDYENQGNGIYKITLDFANIELTLPPDPVPVDLPELSRTVDFSKDDGGRPKFIGGISYGETSSSHGRAGTVYDTTLGYWIAKDSGDTGRPGMSGWNQTFYGNTAGDFYLLVDHRSGPIPTMRLFCEGPDIYAYSGAKCETYNFKGLHRKFLPFDEFLFPDPVNFDLEGISSSSVVRFIMAGFTLPLNYVLLNKGYQDTTVSSNAAVAAVTADACANLKTAAGNNTKVYVIEYKTTASGQIKSCASGSSAPYVQSVGSEAELNNALAVIAADIKSFAGYKNSETSEII